jgi:CheY-like chemotaxis protein
MERGPYHLVITDYALPGQTGAWMLEEGARRDLLGDAAAVIVTAYRDIAKPDGVRVFHKPLDLDQFIAQVGVPKPVDPDELAAAIASVARMPVR